MDTADGAPPRYRPIADYALIGDCHGSALVARDGCIDWAVLHRFDGEPVFCRLLDAGHGGFWSLRPAGEFTSSRAYLPGTNILRTEFRTAGGRIALTDFMPVGRRLDAGVHDYVHLSAPAWIVRRIEVLEGEVELTAAYRPSRAFAAQQATLTPADGVLQAGPGLPTLHGDLRYEIAGDLATARRRMAAGEVLDLVLAGNAVAGLSPCDRVPEFLAVTRAFWEEWIAFCRYRGPWRAAVERSALALKLLTFAPTGAIVAAPTTSLPEEIGGERNWDYRFCWVRDAAFALYALSVLGYSGEAKCFHDYLLGACARSLPEVRPLYGIGGELHLEEVDLTHLEGYRGSAPVRIGNGAYLQRQMDVYGQALDLAHLYRALGGRISTQYQRLLDAIARFIDAHWQEPDQGIWEMRGPPRHHVHSKMMCWAGLDRAAHLLGPAWAARAAAAEASIRAHGIGDAGLRQAYDGGTDAAVLLAPMLGFPLSQAQLEQTLDSVCRDLGRRGFIARYEGEDGLAGGEGAFLVCSAWLADAELAAGRIDAARARIEKLVGCANDVGLYAEEVDAADGRFLGNFPQALTHLGLIGNLVNLDLAERQGAAALQGTYADRARRAVTATFGWRALLAAALHSRRIGRIFSSKHSKLAWP